MASAAESTSVKRGAGLASICSLSITRPVGTMSVTLIVVMLGLLSLHRLAVDLLPAIEFPQIRVTVTYPGVAPEIMEEQVTRILEQGLAATENLVGIDSRVRQGRTDIDLNFRFGTNLDFALQDASRNLEQVRNRLPGDIDPPRIRKFDSGREPVWRGGFSSTVRAESDVTDWVNNELTPRLLTIAGVSAVEAIGGQTREVDVQVDASLLAQYGLTPVDIVHALAGENVDVSAGRLTSARIDIQATTIGLFTSLDDIRNILLPVAGTDGTLLLGDVARVSDGTADQRVFARLNGIPATQVDVYKQTEANTVAVADAVLRELDQLQRTGFIPEDIDFRITRDPTFFIRGALAGLSLAAVIGGVLAILLLLLFLGSLRKGLIISLSIPIALLATFALMARFELTLNMISLGGLALGIGLLLDNGIVMLENIFRHNEQLQKPAIQASHEGAAEVVSAVTAGTLTNLAAVAPFLFLTGAAALVFREMIMTISFAILATLGTALTVVPSLAAVLNSIPFKSGLKERRAVRAFGRYVHSLSDQYRRSLPIVLRFRWLTLGVAALAMTGAGFIFSGLDREFLPALDDGEVSVRISLPPGTPPEETLAVSREVERILMDDPHVQTVFTLVGGTLWGGTVTENAGLAIFLVQLTPAHRRPDMPSGRWIQLIQEPIRALDAPGARISVRPPQIRGLRFTTQGSDVSLRLFGPDLQALDELRIALYDRLQGIPGLENIDDGAEDRSPQLQIRLDRERAARVGLRVTQVGESLRTALDGRVATRFQEGGREYDVRVRAREEDVQDIGRIEELIVALADGQPRFLRDVGRYEFADGPATIWRENQNRVVRITGDINTSIAPINEVIAEIQGRLATLDLPDAYYVLIGGQWETIQDTNRELGLIIGLAIFLVGALLSIQYERLSNPLIILLTAPLSLTGVSLVLWLTGTPVSAPVLIGLVLLIGIAVNNAILLVEYIEKARCERGLNVQEAIIEAGGLRFRPILMTTLTTVFGMLPLAIGLGEGAEILRPLALAVVGGLSLSMLFTLFVAPSLYSVIHDRKKQAGGLDNRQIG